MVGGEEGSDNRDAQKIIHAPPPAAHKAFNVIRVLTCGKVGKLAMWWDPAYSVGHPNRFPAAQLQPTLATGDQPPQVGG